MWCPTLHTNSSKIFVVVDVLTKFCKLYPLCTATIDHTLKAMNKFLEEFPSLSYVLSDRGTQFTSPMWTRYWEQRGTIVKYTSVYRPASNPCERVMGTLGDFFRLHCPENHRRWPLLVPEVERRMNCVEHVVTGVCPITLQRRLKPILMTSNKLEVVSEEEYALTLKKARENVKRAVDNRQTKFAQRNQTVTLEEGDLVYVKQHKLSNADKGIAKKMCHLYAGPCPVVANLGKNTYRVKNNLVDDTYSQQHLNNLKF